MKKELRHKEIGDAITASFGNPIENLDEMIQRKIGIRDLTWCLLLILFCTVFLVTIFTKEHQRAVNDYKRTVEMHALLRATQIWRDGIVNERTFNVKPAQGRARKRGKK